MLSVCHRFEIRRRVVELVAVSVMNNSRAATEHMTMLVRTPTVVEWVDLPVPVLHLEDPEAGPRLVRLEWEGQVQPPNFKESP